MASVVNRINIYALQKGTTWGTAATFGVLDGFYPQSLSGLKLTRSNTPDKGAGMGFVRTSHQGPDQPVSPSFQILPYEDDTIALLLMAMIMGADTVTGAADPYTHTMEAQTLSDYFVSMGWNEDASQVKLLSSAIIESLEITADGDGRIVFNISLKGNTISDGAGTELDTVTYKAQDGVFKFSSLVLRMNAQGGAALASGDEITITDFRLKMTRPSDQVVPAGDSAIIQPKQGGFPEFELEFTIPRRDTSSETIYDAFKAETLQKADMVFSGSSASRELKIELPQVKIVSCESPRDEVITCKVSAQLQKASSTPTGMTTGILAPTAIWKTDIVTSPLA
jgi:hypothetical protein